MILTPYLVNLIFTHYSIINATTRRSTIINTLCFYFLFDSMLLATTDADAQKQKAEKALKPASTIEAVQPVTVQAAPDAVGGTPLVAGLCPYVPRFDQFREQLIVAWNAIQPGVPLTFLSASEWGRGYENDPPPQADVFVFDAIFLESFRSRGFLEKLAPS